MNSFVENYGTLAKETEKKGMRLSKQLIEEVGLEVQLFAYFCIRAIPSGTWRLLQA